ncbi:type II secretion system F family protein [Vibrio sp. RC27]
MVVPILLICFGVLVLVVTLHKNSQKHDYLADFNKSTVRTTVVSDQQAIDLKSLLEQNWKDSLRTRWENIKKQLGKHPYIKAILANIVIQVLVYLINMQFLRANVIGMAVAGVIVGNIMLVIWLQRREETMFERAFPDALNMMTSAISAGESIMHAIVYVGNTLDGDVGAEFKVMGQRMQIGESVDDVFRKSCSRFPYPSFYFFVICLRANIQRGGQLKDIMMRLNRMMFNARSVEKKKFSMTAEARMSVKIVAAIPFIFLFMLQYLSPENYEFVMFHEAGRPILYYVVISEAIGIFIVWMLMRGVR